MLITNVQVVEEDGIDPDNMTYEARLFCPLPSFFYLLLYASISGMSKKWDFLLISFIWFQELQQLGEAIGTESKGLPESVIALLPTSNYKIGIFSRKEKHDE